LEPYEPPEVTEPEIIIIEWEEDRVIEEDDYGDVNETVAEAIATEAATTEVVVGVDNETVEAGKFQHEVSEETIKGATVAVTAVIVGVALILILGIFIVYMVK